LQLTTTYERGNGEWIALKTVAVTLDAKSVPLGDGVLNVEHDGVRRYVGEVIGFIPAAHPVTARAVEEVWVRSVAWLLNHGKLGGRDCSCDIGVPGGPASEQAS
jgi:hypothetical protein